MIKRNSVEWTTFINRLNQIKTKSNREVLCIKCWQMLNCKQKIKHLKQNADHKSYLLTSTQYASELKICELAQGYNKLVKKSDGEEYMISPFAPVNLPQLDKSAINMKVESDNSPNSKVDLQEIDNIIRKFDNGKPSKRQKVSDDTANDRSSSAQAKAVQELASGLVDHMNNQVKNSGTSNVTDQKIDEGESGKKWVPMDQFIGLQQRFQDISQKFDENVKKIDAILKIQDFILNELPVLKNVYQNKSGEKIDGTSLPKSPSQSTIQHVLGQGQQTHQSQKAGSMNQIAQLAQNFMTNSGGNGVNNSNQQNSILQTLISQIGAGGINGQKANAMGQQPGQNSNQAQLLMGQGQNQFNLNNGSQPKANASGGLMNQNPNMGQNTPMNNLAANLLSGGNQASPMLINYANNGAFGKQAMPANGIVTQNSSQNLNAALTSLQGFNQMTQSASNQNLNAMGANQRIRSGQNSLFTTPKGLGNAMNKSALLQKKNSNVNLAQMQQTSQANQMTQSLIQNLQMQFQNNPGMPASQLLALGAGFGNLLGGQQNSNGMTASTPQPPASTNQPQAPNSIQQAPHTQQISQSPNLLSHKIAGSPFLQSLFPGANNQQVSNHNFNYPQLKQDAPNQDIQNPIKEALMPNQQSYEQKERNHRNNPVKTLLNMGRDQSNLKKVKSDSDGQPQDSPSRNGQNQQFDQFNLDHVNDRRPTTTDRRPTANWDEKGRMLDGKIDEDANEAKVRRSDSMQENKHSRNYSFSHV